jgi:DNA-directed RNA polymerase specialized sigma subunit
MSEVDALGVVRQMRDDERSTHSGDEDPESALVVACATLEDRRRLIHVLRRTGWTYEAIGSLLGLSRQRVAQIDRQWAARHPASRFRPSSRLRTAFR